MPEPLEINFSSPSNLWPSSVIVLLEIRIITRLDECCMVETILGLLSMCAFFSYIGSRMLFRSNKILVGRFTVIFTGLNVVISFFIGCAENFRM